VSDERLAEVAAELVSRLLEELATGEEGAAP
jgi:hypothetical protein